MAKYLTTIGLEIHVELKTKTKMFCDSLNDPDEKHPNTNVCPVCMGHPGTLPVINEEAVKKIIGVGLALNCSINRESFFERKNYFYPDLPKGYQISQFQKPFCYDGRLTITTGKTIGIERIHLEEDAGRLSHGNDEAFVDYNRAGLPLMELVTKPDLQTSDDVLAFAKELRLIMRYLRASDADMEKGQMRVEVNLSLYKEGADKLSGTKVEVKNINSISAAGKAVEYEIKRQTEALEAGEKLVQETRGWDDVKQRTVSQRVKEGSADYRYFPEPDLPPLNLSEGYIDQIRMAVPELPSQRRERFKKEYGLNDAQVEVFTVAYHLGNYYERVASELDAAARVEHIEKGSTEVPADEEVLPGKLHALAANYIITEFPPLMNATGLEIDDIEGLKMEPEAFAELMVMLFHKKLSSSAGKTVLKEMAQTGLHPEAIVKDKDLGQMSDAAGLEKIVAEVISANPQPVADYKAGKEASIKFLIGKVMQASKGKANPQVVEEMLKKVL